MDGTLNYGPYSHQKVTPTMIANDESTYNTYKFSGIPSDPVCAVEFEAIKAALFPAKSSYLFFMKKADGSGHSFAKDFENHKANIENVIEVKKKVETTSIREIKQEKSEVSKEIQKPTPPIIQVKKETKAEAKKETPNNNTKSEQKDTKKQTNKTQNKHQENSNKSSKETTKRVDKTAEKIQKQHTSKDEKTKPEIKKEEKSKPTKEKQATKEKPKNKEKNNNIEKSTKESNKLHKETKKEQTPKEKSPKEIWKSVQ